MNPTGRGVPNLTAAQREECEDVIAQLQFVDLDRQAGELHKGDSARLDMQGRLADGGANLQVQIKRMSVACALVAGPVLAERDGSNQRGVARAVISALNQSLDTGMNWTVTR